MSTQQYSLRWNNHQPNFIATFSTLLKTKTFVDVTLAAEGQHILAHKIVLSACSTYFHSLFMDNPTPHPIVILKDITFANLETMVDFIYKGVVNVTEEQLPAVLETAKILKVKGLTEMPETSMMPSQGASSVDTPQLDRQPDQPVEATYKKIKRRRKSSCDDNTHVGAAPPDILGGRHDESEDPNLTLSDIPQQQLSAPASMNIEQLCGAGGGGMPQGQWSMDYGRYSAGGCIGSGGGPMQSQSEQSSSSYLLSSHSSHGVDHHLDAMPDCVGGLSSAGGQNDSLLSQELIAQTPARRRRTANPQGEENFQKALEAVRFGGIGFCKAARIFGVNNRTLWLEYKKKGYPNNRPSIRSRVKKEHQSPPPDTKMETPLQHDMQQQMAFICNPGQMPYLEPRPLDIPIQGMASNTVNLLGVNFNQLQ